MTNPILMTYTITHPDKWQVNANYVLQYMGYGYLKEGELYRKWSWYWLGYVWAVDVKQSVTLKDLDLVYYN